MFNKTIRSALSALLVFCLLFSLSGNAIAMAVSNPVTGAIDSVDSKFNATVADLEKMIADLEAEVATQEQNLADAQNKLESGKEDLAEAQKTLDEKKELLEEARAELDKLQGKLDEADEMLGKLEEKAAEYQAQLDDAQKQLDDAQVKLDDAQKQLDDAQVKLNDANAQLAEKQAQLDDAKAQLDEADKKFEDAMAEFLALEAEVKAMPEGPAKDAAQAELDKLGAEVTAANDELEAAHAKLDDAQAQLDNADKQLKDAQKLLTEKQAEKNDAQALKDQYQADKDAYQAKLDDAKAQLADAQEQVAWAKGEYQKLYDTIDEIEATIDNYQAKADEADAAVVKAEETLPKAEKALVEANEALADAKTAVENLKATYATLHNAVTNPTLSLDFYRDTIATLEAQMKTLWASVLALQTSLDELIAAYKELEGFAINPIVIEDYYFEGLVIEAFEVGEYHYEEVGFHFNGYKFDGYTVDAVTVEGYTFEGFTAPEMPAQLTQLDATLDNAIAKVITLNETVKTYVAAAKPIIAKALDVSEDALRFTYNALKNNLNKEGAVKVYNWLYNNPDKVCAIVKEFGVYGLDLVMKYGPYAMDLLEEHSDLAILAMKLTMGGTYLTVTLGAAVLGYVGDKLAFLADYKDEVLDVVRKLYFAYGDEAKALVEVYVDYLNLRERYYNSTHADYTIFHDSLYVAIGDSTAVGPNSYVDKLAELLEIPHMTENLAQMDLTVEEAIDLVNQNADLIGKADLVTLGFSNIDASTAMLNTLVQNYENEWTEEVGKDVAKGIDKVIAELKERMVAYGVGEDKIAMLDKANELIDKAMVALYEKLVEEGLDEATTTMVMEASEAYLAAYVSRMAWYPVLVDAVYEINPDAQIVIVGTYNDLEDVVVDVASNKINIGYITRALTAVANLENLAQAFIGDECIYVHASAVETVFEENDYEDLNNLGYVDSILNDEMLPSDAGHAYIAEEIREALNVEYKIWGDVNGDRQVNCRDARLILQYAAGLIGEDDLDLTWGDVNGDGKVNSRDARLILQLRAELIEHFPVCKLA